MRKVINAWGLAVGNVFETARTTCRLVSTHYVDMRATGYVGSGKSGVLRSLSDNFPTSFTQEISVHFNLLIASLSPVSTAPIITNVKKGFEKQ